MSTLLSGVTITCLPFVKNALRGESSTVRGYTAVAKRRSKYPCAKKRSEFGEILYWVFL
jgi:hypothetical protein